MPIFINYQNFLIFLTILFFFFVWCEGNLWLVLSVFVILYMIVSVLLSIDRETQNFINITAIFTLYKQQSHIILLQLDIQIQFTFFKVFLNHSSYRRCNIENNKVMLILCKTFSARVVYFIFLQALNIIFIEWSSYKTIGSIKCSLMWYIPEKNDINEHLQIGENNGVGWPI